VRSTSLVIVLASVIVPSQAKVTFPPPAMANRRASSVHVLTTPPARTASGSNGSRAAIPAIALILNRVQDRFEQCILVFMATSLLEPGFEPRSATGLLAAGG
jgi:hypothetical protein